MRMTSQSLGRFAVAAAFSLSLAPALLAQRPMPAMGRAPAPPRPAPALVQAQQAANNAMNAACVTVAGALAQQRAIPPSKPSPLTAAELPDALPSIPEVDEFLNSAQPPKETSKKVRRVQRELDWNSTLKLAIRDAKRLDRPIIWIQAYGKLDGYC